MVSGGGPSGAEIRNELLATLPADELARLRPHLTREALASGRELHAPGAPITDVYFIEQGLASFTANTFDGGSVEVGLAGREGMVGIAAFLMPDMPALHRAFIQIPGSALRMDAAAFRAALNQCPELRRRCLHFVGAFMAQAAQTAACNARHEITERLARWLLMSLDRVDGNELPLTQEFLSLMLGVRRAGVVVAASALQSDDLIRYARGRITVLDRPGLEEVSCQCYQFVKQLGSTVQNG